MDNILGLFEKKLEGDDALLSLAALRYRAIGLGIEFSATTVGHALHLLSYRPTSQCKAILHLDRKLNVLTKAGQDSFASFVNSTAPHLYGMVLHDHRSIRKDPALFIDAIKKLSSQVLEPKADSPFLFIEHASGLSTEAFLGIFHSLRELPNVSACLDIGHIGLTAVRDDFKLRTGGKKVFRIFPDSDDFLALMPQIEASVQTALPQTLKLLEGIATHKKPLHFHLHDGHPLLRRSNTGVADHAGFLDMVDLPYPAHGKIALPLMYGVDGLRQIARAASSTIEDPSYTIEIHPDGGSLPLKSGGELFHHWSDRSNSERMNHWMQKIRANYLLLESIIRESANDNL